jgi:putative endonuclease
MKRYYVYLLASKKNGALYIGVTNNLINRVCKHKNNSIDGFTKYRDIHNLVYFEEHNNIHKAIAREKQMKKWRRQWKVRLIEELNPQWRDLYPDLIH